ncbi:MAG: L-serine ammonia-lyase, iron-sulfur-dependent subunit beta [[Clostridium] scindens]
MGNIFDILGPVMVGPSSSHTAGAARIGLIARQLFGRQPEKATIYLHGSFAATGKGHGTDKALIAGLLGMMPDDMRIPDSFEVAKAQGMEFEIKNKDIKEAHPNTAQIVMEAEGVPTMKIQAFSHRGRKNQGLRKLDGIDVNFSGESYTLIIRNVDEPGRIMEVAAALSKAEINIATMQVFRDKRGGFAVMVVETDQVVPQEAIDALESKEGIIRVKFLNPNGTT